MAPALRRALDLLHMPSLVRVARAEALPPDVATLLRIAVKDGDAVNEAVQATGRPPDVIIRAASFFIEQVLLAPDTDSYRVLGAEPGASAGELRRNMAALQMWLHPDIEHDPHRSMLAARVSQAWNDLKTTEKRTDYDHLLTLSSPEARPGDDAGRSPRKALRSKRIRSVARGKTADGGSAAEAKTPSPRTKRRSRRLPFLLEAWLLLRPDGRR